MSQHVGIISRANEEQSIPGKLAPTVAGVALSLTLFTYAALQVFSGRSVALMLIGMMSLLAIALMARSTLNDWRVDRLKNLLDSVRVEIDDDGEFEAVDRDGDILKGYLTPQWGDSYDDWLR